MKRFKLYIYITLIIFAILIGFFIYKVSGQNNQEEDKREKTLSEINYLEDRFVNLFNELNDITFENYKISINDLEEEDENSNLTENTAVESGSNSSSSSQSGNQTSGKTSNKSKSNKEYSMESTGILTKDSEIDWKQIKSDVEIIYERLYSSTLDLYEISSKQEDIVNFNKEFDNLTIAVRNEDKQTTLIELAKLYNYLPGFFESCSNYENKNTIIKTKSYLFQAYSILETEDWESISNNVNKSIQEFTKLVTDVNHPNEQNQYSINKTYIILNELNNATYLRDKDVFLIKYKNVLEELENL